MIPPGIRAFAEDPMAAGPDPAPETGTRRVLDDRFCFLEGPFFTSVSRLRLRPNEVEATLAEVRALAGEQPWPTAWWLGESATPPDLAERLLALGLRRATDPSWEPVGTAMATVTAPPSTPGIEARRVASFEEFALANEIVWECFEVPEAEREVQRASQEERWQRERAGHAAEVFLAWVDGAPAAVGRALFLPEGASLFGGSVLPGARGRGAYRALVRARWDAAAARGTPALVTTAGAMSRPILERLGFEPVSRVEILLD